MQGTAAAHQAAVKPSSHLPRVKQVSLDIPPPRCVIHRALVTSVMRSSRPGLSVLLVLVVLLGRTAPTATADDNPVSLLEGNLAAQRFPDFQADATLTTTLPAGDTVTLQIRLLAMIEPDSRSRKAVTRVVSGGSLKGSGFLNVEHPKAPDDLWVYLPAVRTARRLVSTNLGDSYLGSEFRYGDLVQLDPDDYRVTLRSDETVAGEPCHVLEIVPRDQRLVRDTGLSKQLLWLRKSNLIERKFEQYDRRGELLKVIEVPRLFNDPASGKFFAVERRVQNVQTGAQSVAVFENVRVNSGMSADLFTPVRLAEGR